MEKLISVPACQVCQDRCRRAGRACAPLPDLGDAYLQVPEGRAGHRRGESLRRVVLMAAPRRKPTPADPARSEARGRCALGRTQGGRLVLPGRGSGGARGGLPTVARVVDWAELSRRVEGAPPLLDCGSQRRAQGAQLPRVGRRPRAPHLHPGTLAVPDSRLTAVQRGRQDQGAVDLLRRVARSGAQDDSPLREPEPHGLWRRRVPRARAGAHPLP